MEPRLIPLNAWIALLTGEGGWPAPLRDQGFRIQRFEIPISTSRTSVVVDGLGLNADRQILLPTECKSGNNVEADQAQRYEVMTADNVARNVTLPFPPTGAIVQPLYACLEESQERVVTGLRAIGFQAPLLVIGSSSVKLETRGSSVLTPFEVNVPAGPPPRLIPVDADSPDEELREVLLPAIVAAAARGETVITFDSLLAAAIPYSSVYGQRARSRMRDRATTIVRRMSEGELTEYLSVEPGGADIQGSVLRILRSPAAFDPRGETQGWQSMRRKAERTLRGRPRAARVPAGQMSFEDLGQEIERGEG